MYSNSRIVYLTLAACLCLPTMAALGSNQIDPPPVLPSSDTEKRIEPDTQDVDKPFVYQWEIPTDQFIQETPLGELTSWIRRQWSDGASATHFGRGRTGDVIMVVASRHPLTDDQWSILAGRAADEFKNIHGDQLMSVYGVVFILTEIPGDNSITNLDKLIEAIESRLFDPNTVAAKLAADALFFTNKYLSNVEEANGRIILLLSAIEQAKPGNARAAMIQALQSISYKFGYAGHDAEVLDLMHKILESPNLTGRERGNASMAIGSAKGDLHEAAVKAAKGLESTDYATRNLSLLTLKRFCSIYENEDPVSRQQAREVAIPAITKLFRANPTDHTAQSIMGMCGHIGEQVAIWVPDIIPYLDHHDVNIQGSAIWALTQIGPAASDALPKLRSMNGTTGDLNESVRDALYFIAKEGTKPNWYDDHIKRLKEAEAQED